MEPMPLVQELMTPMPVTVDEATDARSACELMEKHGVHHLPVLRGGEAVGVVSDREVKVALLFPGPGQLLMRDLLTGDPYIVGPAVQLDEVVLELERNRRGCALVCDEGKRPLGIVTEHDLLRAYRELLQQRHLFTAA